jgi:stage II sporulation protein R
MKKRQPYIIIASILIAFLLLQKSNAESNDVAKLTEGIASKILRFHVIANSDSDFDQDLKIKVKEAVINYLSEHVDTTSSLLLTKENILEHNEEIIDVATSVLKAANVNYSIHTEITTGYFPLKSYGDITLPAGKYETLRIVIGEGTGQNWWCILYPPLCFIDACSGIVPADSKELLKNILTDDEFSVITTGLPREVEIRFKFLPFLNGLFN